MKDLTPLQNIEAFFAEKTKDYFPGKSPLEEAILYSLLAPGKRIRPLLVQGFARGLNGNEKLAFIMGFAVEMIHTYSLIHDDLPAMDNDDFRRGRPSNHKAHGEALAILAGDSLLNLAPEFLMRELTKENVEPQLILEITTRLLQASGHTGMIKGQTLDIQFESEDLTKFQTSELQQILKSIHQLKTGAIITWSCLAGLYCHSDREFIQKHKCKIESIGQRIGLLFQVVDDVLDVIGTKEELGKTPGKDQHAGKLTYPHLYGLEGAKSLGLELAGELSTDINEMEYAGGDWSIIRTIVQSLNEKIN